MTAASTQGWIERAEQALKGASHDEVSVLSAGRPPVLDALGRRALLSPLLAAFMWSAAVFRETVSGNPLDGLTLLFRLLALIFTVRALVLCYELGRRLRAHARRGGFALALHEEGLLLRTPETDFVVPKSDVVDIRIGGQWQRDSGRRWADVYILTRPQSGRSYLALPPYFDRSPGALAERLMRWQGPPDAGEASAADGTGVEEESRKPAKLATKLFDEVAEGARPPGTAVIEHGRGWLRRGPYATWLLGLAVLDGFLRLPPHARDSVGWQAPAVLALALGIVPALWIVMTRFDIAPRKGIALILTPAEMLMRTRAGVHRVRWEQIKRLEVQSRTSWSLLQGQHQARTLVIERKNDEPITYTEAFLGAPVEVVVGLGEAYRKGRLP